LPAPWRPSSELLLEFSRRIAGLDRWIPLPLLQEYAFEFPIDGQLVLAQNVNAAIAVYLAKLAILNFEVAWSRGRLPTANMAAFAFQPNGGAAGAGRQLAFVAPGGFASDL
jgi:hypothetical protein